MLIDRPQIVEGSSIQNATVQSGNTAVQNLLLSTASVGELFYNTQLGQLSTYNGSLWDALPTGVQFITHLADQALHLTSVQNTLLDGLSQTLLSTELNFVQGVTSPIQTQLNVVVSTAVAQAATLTNLQTQITATQATSATALNSHIADLTLHLTAAENMFLDGLDLPTITSADVNSIPALTANLAGLTTTFTAHAVNYALHLTAAQNTFLDGINLGAVSILDFNRLAGIDAYLTSTGSSTIGSNFASLVSTKVSKAGDTMTGTLTMSNGSTITGLPVPMLPGDAVPKSYVDAFVNGVQWALSVKAVSTANVALAGLLIIDGVQTAANDRVLVVYQSTQAENGIYLASAGAWSRAPDFSTAADINNAAVFVLPGGTSSGKSTWIQIDNVVNVGTDAVAFTPFSGPVITSAGNGIALTPGGGVSVLEGAGLTFSGNTLVVDPYPSGGLINTVNGTSPSTAAIAQLALTQTGVVAGTYNSVGTSVTPFTVDGTGRLTGTGAAVTITPAFSAITGKPTTLAGYGVVDAQALNAELTALSNTAGTGLYTRTGFGASVTRSVAVQGAGLSITNGDGVGGNPTVTSNASSSNVPSTIVLRDVNGDFTANVVHATLAGNATGNAGSATKLFTARTLSVSGGAVGSVLFDGSADAAIVISSLNAPALTGLVPVPSLSGTYNINISGTAGTASSTPYAGVTGRPAIGTWATIGGDLIARAISWSNYGNGHVIFDGSSSLSPTGTAISNLAAQVPWTPSYPMLMGWNGAGTYGVRVDSARVSDNTTGNAGTATLSTKSSTLAQGGGNGGAMTFNYAGQNGQPAWLWGTNDGGNMYVWNPANFSVSYAGTAGNANSITNALGESHVWTGINYFLGNKGAGSYLGSNVSYGLEAYSTDGGSAAMSFHRSGAFAVNMGLDPDNVFRIGGWSAAANRLQMDMSGNLTMAGDVTAFSDERLKQDISVIDVALDRVSLLRGVTFTRIEDGVRGTGVIAQEVQAVLPEAVHTGSDGMLSVAYGNMVGLLIEAIKELNTEVKQLREDVAFLKSADR